jgi:peptidoglycan hydrolase-like protein with peptidoglycan-binding domain
MPGMTDLFGALAFLEMLTRGGQAPAPSPVPVLPPAPLPMPVPAIVPPSPAPQPAVFHIPPPGDIGPPPPGYDVPPMPAPPAVPVAPPVDPGVLPPMPPWNQGAGTPCPADSPPFPGPGWVPDTPVATAVAARATYWNPLLWDYPSKTIAHAFVCEQFGGRWMVFAAAWHPGDSGPQTYMATEAWRLVAAQPMPAAPVVPAPTPVAPAPTPVVPVVVNTPLQAAALAMASALNAHGYKMADQPVYKAFQSAAKTTPDGFPGTGTMGLLRSALASIIPPVPMPNVPIYPWKAAPGTSGYDGRNAPTWAQWSGQAPAPVVVVTPGAPVFDPAVTPAMGPPAAVQPYPGTGAWQTNAPYIARYQSALTYLSSMNPAFDPHGVDGKYGPNTAAAVKAFQAAHGLTQDGEAGAQTAAALDAAMGSVAHAA